MNIRYYAEASFPWPPGRDTCEVDLDTDTDALPPNLARAVREDGWGAVLGEWWEWRSFGATLIWRVDPA